MPEPRAKTAAIKTIFISLFSLDAGRNAWQKLDVPRLPSRILSEIYDVLKTAFADGGIVRDRK